MGEEATEEPPLGYMAAHASKQSPAAFLELEDDSVLKAVLLDFRFLGEKLKALVNSLSLKRVIIKEIIKNVNPRI